MDKARTTFPIPVDFNDAELPTATKLNGLSHQTRTAFGLIEMMIGDIWGDSGDGILHPTGNPNSNANFIPNLARSIGDQSLLNERLNGPTLNSNMVYTDAIGTRYEGKTEAYLLYPPDTGKAITISAATWIKVATPQQVIGTEMYAVTSNGKVFTYDAIPAGLTITYTPIMDSDVGTEDTSGGHWNVIPDPQHWSVGFSGVKISEVAGSPGDYHIWLPPRQVLGVNSRRLVKSMNTTGSDANTTSTPDGAGYKAFQAQNVAASVTNGNHYRYQLPLNLQSVAAGTTLPVGMLYLWDESRGCIVNGITFKVTSGADFETTKRFRITATGTDLATIFGSSISTAADHTAASYQTPFKLIINSVSLSKCVSALGTAFYNHSHTNADGSLPIKHSDLLGLIPGGNYVASAWASDDHTQYLHRRGYVEVPARDGWNNAMLGPVRVANTATPSTVWTQLTEEGIEPASTKTVKVTGLALTDSKIWFGDVATQSVTGPKLKLENGQFEFYTDENGVAQPQIKAGSFQALPSQAFGGEVGYNYVVAKTQYYVLGPSDFNFVQNGSASVPTIQYLWANHYLENLSGSDACTGTAIIHIPNGAVIGSTNTIKLSASKNCQLTIGVYNRITGAVVDGLSGAVVAADNANITETTASFTAAIPFTFDETQHVLAITFTFVPLAKLVSVLIDYGMITVNN